MSSGIASMVATWEVPGYESMLRCGRHLSAARDIGGTRRFWVSFPPSDAAKAEARDQPKEVACCNNPISIPLDVDRPFRYAPLLGKTVRLRDKDQMKFVLRQPCIVCDRLPSDPHHLTFTQPRALGYRVSDKLTVPVCRIHHREPHRSGDEAGWWQKLNIDPLPVALRLWQHTRLNGDELAPSEGIAPSQAA